MRDFVIEGCQPRARGVPPPLKLHRPMTKWPLSVGFYFACPSTTGTLKLASDNVNADTILAMYSMYNVHILKKGTNLKKN